MIANAIIGILAFCVLFNFRHSPKSTHRKLLNVMLIYWLLSFGAIIYMFNANGFSHVFNNNIVSMKLILTGIPSYMAIISYPIISIHPRILEFRLWIRYAAPIIIVFATYFIWHWANGVDPFYEYNTMGEFAANIGSTSVILRLVTVVTFMAYIVISLMTTWQIIPLYNKVITDNLADNSYNIDWLHSLIVFITVIGIFYFSMLFTSSMYVNTAYLLSVLALFVFMTDRVIFAKTLEDLEPLKIKWNRSQGWHVAEAETNDSLDDTPEPVSLERLKEVGDRIDRWIDQTQVYTRIDFTTQDIFDQFPDLRHEDLTYYSKVTNESFQAYVRRKRIALACKLIEENCHNIYPKQLYSMVGFSHYSSFSRSFYAVTGKSPSDYITSVQQKA